jgi:GNAT superfamily N-acetyltransferase
MNDCKNQFRSYDSASQFLLDAREFLSLNEDVYNSLVTVAKGSGDSLGSFSPPYWYGAIADGEGAIRACAIHAVPDGLICSDLDNSDACLIAGSVGQSLRWPKRLSGPPSAVKALAKELQVLGSPKYDVHKEWTIYKIDSAPSPRSIATGSLRRATSDDEKLVRKWGRLYDVEKPAFTSIEDFFVRKLEREELYLWDSNGPRTVLSMSGKTQQGIRISAVFTPRENRGRGFASAATIAASNCALSQGLQFVTLHALTGDRAEHLYRRIGYVEIGRYFSATTRTAST